MFGDARYQQFDRKMRVEELVVGGKRKDKVAKFRVLGIQTNMAEYYWLRNFITELLGNLDLGQKVEAA